MSSRPFAQVATLIVKRPDVRAAGGYRWGYYLAAAREERGLDLETVAAEMGVEPWRLGGWETQTKSFPTEMIPRFIAWLGFVPWEFAPCTASTFGERVKRTRDLLGLSSRTLQSQYGIPTSTLSQAELRSKFPIDLVIRLEEVLGVPLEKHAQQSLTRRRRSA